MLGIKPSLISRKAFCLIAFTFLICLINFRVHAENFKGASRNNIHFQHLDVELTLPHPTVFDVAQDHEGFIWFATQGGLAKFNGVSSKYYTAQPDSEIGLNSNWIWQVFIDSEGRIWATSPNGIHLYNPQIDHFINFDSNKFPAIHSRNYGTIAEASDGKLWFGADGFITIFDPKTSNFSSLNNITADPSLLADSKVRDINILDSGQIFVATLDNGIYKSGNLGKSFEVFNLKSKTLPSDKIIRIATDKKNNLWIATEGDGLIKADLDGKVLAQYRSNVCSNSFNDILVDHKNSIWLATHSGLCEFSPQNNTFTLHVKDPGKISSLINNDVRALLQDEGGVIWVATVSGVSKWNAKLADFSHIPKTSELGSLTSASVTSFAMNKSSLFIGTIDGGVNILDLKTNKLNAFNSSQSNLLAQIDNSLVTSLLTEGEHGIWIGTYDRGLFYFDLNDFSHVNYAANNSEPYKLSHDAVSKIIRLANGNLAVSTYGGGTNIITAEDKQVSQLGAGLPLSNRENFKFVLDLFEDQHQNVWIATHGDGLHMFNPKSLKVTTFSTQKSDYYHLPSDEIFSVIRTQKGTWAATSNTGVVLIPNNPQQQKITFNQNSGLASNFTYSLLEDALGFIWVSHAKGLSRINPKTLDVNNFNTTHGLQSSDFNNSAYYKAPNGRLFFGGSNGFNTFLPTDVPLNSYKPPLKLTKFVHANEEKPIQTMLRADGVLELNYEDTIIDFEFAALDYTKPSNNRYQYMMEGLSSVWSNIGTSNHISFSYLSDGNYTLRVRGSNNEEVWSEELQIEIEVLPPWWKSIHAKLLYIFGPIFIFLQLLRNQRIKHQRQLSHERRLHQLAYFDGLTGLPNRQSFYENLDKFLSLAKRGNYKAGVMFIDLDRFKRINDTLGHDYGDLVLQEVAQRLKECVRDSDFVARNYEVNTFNNEIARLGGDEFTLFLSHIESAAETTLITQRIIDSLSKPIKIDSYELTVTPSVGIALYPEHGTSVHDLMKHADIAMYQAKEDGRRTFKFYSNQLNDRALERLQLEEKMRLAVKNNEFTLHYQPQVDIHANEITKAEALIRWTNPELGFISPADFIPIAEESGMIVEIGEWVLNTACYQAKQWYDEGISNCKVSVNVSSVQFKQTALIDIVKQALIDSGLPAHLLELELTESAVMSDVDDNIERLQQFKDMGITIAIDDFGTGYSSLSYLKKFPIDTLKIDRSFVTEIANSDNDAAIVKAIMLLAQTMELKVVAEGIENIEQLKILNDYDCQYIQGYYFSRPLPYAEFTQFVETDFYADKVKWEKVVSS